MTLQFINRGAEMPVLMNLLAMHLLVVAHNKKEDISGVINIRLVHLHRTMYISTKPHHNHFCW